MQKPTWVKVVGVLLIIMGCFGALGSYQTFKMPKAMERIKEMMPEMKQRLEQRGSSATSSERVMQMYEKMGNVPPWFGSWCLLTGTIALIISVLYILTAVNLFQLKKTAISMFYWVMAIDIIFLIVRGVIGMTAMSWLGMSMILAGGLAVVVDIILLLVVGSKSKEAFLQSEPG